MEATVVQFGNQVEVFTSKSGHFTLRLAENYEKKGADKGHHGVVSPMPCKISQVTEKLIKGN